MLPKHHTLSREEGNREGVGHIGVVPSSSVQTVVCARSALLFFGASFTHFGASIERLFLFEKRGVTRNKPKRKNKENQ